MTVDEFLRAADVRDEYAISTSTLATWRRSGTGPRWQRLGGRRIVYRRSEIEAWIAAEARRDGAA